MATTAAKTPQQRTNAMERPSILAAAVEIFRSAGDVAEARVAADELAGVADGSSSPVPRPP